jgi:hypothetical protein
MIKNGYAMAGVWLMHSCDARQPIKLKFNLRLSRPKMKRAVSRRPKN